MGKIAEITVPAGGQATIDFAAIDQTYKHLVVVVTGRNDAANNESTLQMQLNGDTAANYDWVRTEGYATGTNTSSGTGVALPTIGSINGANAATGKASLVTVELANYAGTTFHKTWLASSADRTGYTPGGINVDALSGAWSNTAAITRLTLSLSAGNFAAGTVATLYGVDSQVAGAAGTPYQTNKVQLDWAATTDLANSVALPAATWTDVCPAQPFTVDDAASLIEATISGYVQVGTNNNSDVAARLVIDAGGAAPLTKLISGAWIGTQLYNVLAGSTPVPLTGLVAGTHTIKLQVYSEATNLLTVRPATHPQTESLFMRVIERKTTTSAAGAGATSQGASACMDAVRDYLAGHTGDPIDTLIHVGPWVAFVYFTGVTSAGWHSATNATWTVSSGKTLVAVEMLPSMTSQSDPGNRTARLLNVTDNVDVIDSTNGRAGWNYGGDVSTPSAFQTVAAGKVCTLQLYNTDSTKRASGAVVLCREV